MLFTVKNKPSRIKSDSKLESENNLVDLPKQPAEKRNQDDHSLVKSSKDSSVGNVNEVNIDLVESGRQSPENVKEVNANLVESSKQSLEKPKGDNIDLVESRKHSVEKPNEDNSNASSSSGSSNICFGESQSTSVAPEASLVGEERIFPVRMRFYSREKLRLNEKYNRVKDMFHQVTNRDIDEATLRLEMNSLNEVNTDVSNSVLPTVSELVLIDDLDSRQESIPSIDPLADPIPSVGLDPLANPVEGVVISDVISLSKIPEEVAASSTDKEAIPFRRRTSSSGEDDNCSICLSVAVNKCFAGSCLHYFCLECLTEWTKLRLVCFKKCLYKVSHINLCIF